MLSDSRFWLGVAVAVLLIGRVGCLGDRRGRLGRCRLQRLQIVAFEVEDLDAARVPECLGDGAESVTVNGYHAGRVERIREVAPIQ